MKRLMGRLVSITIIIISLIVTNNYCVSAKVNEKLNILFISSFNANFISFNDQVRGIKAGFNGDVNLRIEYMDVKVFNTEEKEKDFYQLLKYSLKNYEKFDAIIAGDDEALEFCVKYREELFKDIPISFLGIQDGARRERATSQKLISGVAEVESIKENIELIRKFHKNIRNIYFLNNYGEDFYSEISSVYNEFNFDKIITSDISIEEFQEIISSLENDCAIISIYPECFRDGEWLSVDEVNEFIIKYNKDIPIYNVLNYSIGTGSIGGKVIDHYTQGKKAAEIAIELLNGKNELELYINDDSANNYVFDYDVIKKFGINKSDLPKGAIILNDPIEIIYKYKSMFIGILISFIGLISIVIALSTYINYKKRYEKQILKAMNEAEEANKLKSYFIANISHELMTPINVIMSAIQLAKVNIKLNNYDACDNNFNSINDNCYRLLRLLNNIIDVEKVKSNNTELKLENINIVNLIEDLVLSVVSYANTKNLDIIFDTTEEEVIMAVDCNKIERIILNLLSNSIKFSKDKGTIKVNLILKKDILKIIIADDGIGIEDKNISKIFDSFMQIDNSLNRKNEGTGIGLSVVKSFVDLHNGEIYVESQINIGTKFIIELPVKVIDYNIESKNTNVKKSTRIELADIYL